MSLRTSLNIFNTAISETLRKRKALTFRKTLGVYNYKIKPSGYYKNQHSINLHYKEKLINEGSDGYRKIKAIEESSNRPFGKFNSLGKFTLDKNKVPEYNIPNEHKYFKLKPYVEYATPDPVKPPIFYTELNENLLGAIKNSMANSNDPEILKLKKDIFDTPVGKWITKKYFKMKREKNYSLTNY